MICQAPKLAQYFTNVRTPDPPCIWSLQKCASVWLNKQQFGCWGLQPWSRVPGCDREPRKPHSLKHEKLAFRMSRNAKCQEQPMQDGRMRIWKATIWHAQNTSRHRLSSMKGSKQEPHKSSPPKMAERASGELPGSCSMKASKDSMRSDASASHRMRLRQPSSSGSPPKRVAKSLPRQGCSVWRGQDDTQPRGALRTGNCARNPPTAVSRVPKRAGAPAPEACQQILDSRSKFSIIGVQMPTSETCHEQCEARV